MADKPTGGIFERKSDIENLADSLKDTKEKSSTKDEAIGTVPKTPTYSDINKFAGNIGMTVATGFVLLHNDLEMLIKSSGGSGGMDWKTALVGAIGVALTGGIEALTSGLGNILSAGLEGGSKLISAGGDAVAKGASAIGESAVNVIDALKSNKATDFLFEDEESNREIAQAEDIMELRKAYSKGYLRAYYSDLIGTLGYYYDYKEDTLTKEDTLGSGVHDVFSGALSGIGSGLGQIVDSVAGAAENIKLNQEDDVYKLRKSSYKAYVRAYYANMIQPYGYLIEDINGDDWKLTRQNNAVAVFEDIGQALGSLVASTAAPLLDTITNFAANIAANDSDVMNVRKTGYKAYVRAYYANMIQPYGYAIDDINGDDWKLSRQNNAVAVFEDIGQALGSLVASTAAPLLDTITNTTANAIINGDKTVSNVRKTGYKAYLKAYYANMIQPFGYAIDDINNEENWTLERRNNAVAVFEDIGQALGGLVSGVSGALLNSVVDTTANAILNADEGVRKTRVEGYKAYLKVYYLKLLENEGYTVDINNLNRDKFIIEKGGFGHGAVRGFLSDLGSGLGGLFGSIGGSIVNGFKTSNDSDLNNDPEIRPVRVQGYKALLTISYGKLKESLDELSATKDPVKKVAGKLLSDFSKDLRKSRGDISITPDESQKEKYRNILDAVYNKMYSGINALDNNKNPVKSAVGKILKSYAKGFALKDESFNNADTIKTLRESGYKKILDSLYEKFDSGIKALSDTKNPVKGALKKILNSYAKGFIVDDDAFNNNAEIVSSRLSGYKNILEALYQKFSAGINNLDANNKKLNKAIEKILNSYAKGFIVDDDTFNNKEDIVNSRLSGYKNILEALYQRFSAGINNLDAGNKKLNKAIEKILNSYAKGFIVDDDSLNNNEDIVKFRASGYRNILEALYQRFSAGINSIDNGNKKLTNAIDKMLNSYAKGFIVSDDSLNNDKDIVNSRASGYRNILDSLYSKFTAGIDNLKNNDKKVTGAIDTIFDSYARSFELSDNLLSEESSIKEARVSGYKKVVSSMYDKFHAAINGLSATSGDVKNYAKDVMKSLSTAFKDAAFDGMSLTISNESRDYSDKLDLVISYLMKINKSSSDINSNVDTIKDNGGVYLPQTGTYGGAGSAWSGAPE